MEALTLEIGDIGTSAHLDWRLKKISCRACLFFYYFLDLHFLSSITEFRIEEKIHAKAVADVYRDAGG